MTYLYLDIETIPCQDADIRAELVANAKPPANYKKPETIEAWRETNAKEIIAKTSFDGGLGHICQINAAHVDDKFSCSLGPDLSKESSDLKAFSEFLEHCRSNVQNIAPVITGHNVNGFDIPFLWKRAICLGVKLPSWFPRNPKPWSDETFDTMLRWDAKNFISQDRLARILGIPGKQGMDGSMVAGEWEAGNYEKIANYCMDDVQTVKAIHERMAMVGV